MKILALELSSTQRSVAALVDDRLVGSALETNARAATALALVERALHDAKLQPEQVDCLAVSLGPGSYTGIRSAIAIAQGWQLARPVRLLGIGVVECLAAQALALGWRGPVRIAIDAQRQEFHLATCALEPDRARVVEPFHLATLAQVRRLVEEGETVVGPDLARWFPKARPLFPDAATLGRLAATRTDFVEGERLEPIYLRETRFVKAPPPRVVPAVETPPETARRAK